MFVVPFKQKLFALLVMIGIYDADKLIWESVTSFAHVLPGTCITIIKSLRIMGLYLICKLISPSY